jgi:biopolymer transport protein ExbB
MPMPPRDGNVHSLAETWSAASDFLESGGWVLGWILFTTFLMWTFIIERYWYLRSGHARAVREAIQRWQDRSERRSWRAHQIRRAMISRVSSQLSETVPLIKTLVALCPLLGLLGTVTGMIEVFDVMSVAGSGNPRAMASGVSRAILPTMAGMVAALSGFIVSVRLEKRTQVEAERIADQLAFE